MPYRGPVGLMFSFRFGRGMPVRGGAHHEGRHMARPTRQSTFNRATHCGATHCGTGWGTG